MRQAFRNRLKCWISQRKQSKKVFEHVVAGFLQAWMHLGLFEQVTSKKIVFAKWLSCVASKAKKNDWHQGVCSSPWIWMFFSVRLGICHSVTKKLLCFFHCVNMKTLMEAEWLEECLCALFVKEWKMHSVLVTHLHSLSGQTDWLRSCPFLLTHSLTWPFAHQKCEMLCAVACSSPATMCF